MPATVKKIHPADQLDRDAVFTATSFNAFFRKGPNDKISRPAATLIEAMGHVENIKAELALDGFKGKVTPLIYAIQPSGAQSPVPADMIEAARAGTLSAPTPATEPKEADMAATATKTKTAAKKAPAKKAAAKNTPAKKPSNVVKLPVAKKAAPKAEAAAPVAGKRAAIEAAAKAGTLPAPPDFSAETHKRFRGKLDEVIALVKAGDVKGLKGFKVNPVSSSPKAIDRYRNLAVIALEAKAAK